MLNAAMTQHPTPQNWLSIFALGLIWGGTFMIVGLALDGYGPLTVACARTSLGALAMLGLMAAMRRPLPSRNTLPHLAIIGVTNTALPFALLSWGQQFVPSAFAGLSMAALPLFVLPLAHVFSDERLSLRKTMGVMVGFIGALVLIGPGVLRLGTGMEPLGQLACLAATFSYACASVLTRRCPPIDPISMTAATLLVGAGCLIPAMLWFEGVPTPSGTGADWAILFLGFVPTALAALLRVLVIRSAGSTFMTLVNFQVPVWSVVFGTMVMGEVLPTTFFAALALILSGLFVSQGPAILRHLRQAAD